MAKLSISFLLLFLFSTSLPAQINLFEKYSSREGFKIIGIGMSAEARKNYRDLSFILNDSAAISREKANWTLSRPEKFFIQQGYFEILVMKGKEIVESFSVSPETNRINAHNQSYYFDTAVLQRLHKEHPFDYFIKTDTCYSPKEAEALEEGLKNNKDCFLTSSSVPLKIFEGEYFLTYDKSKAIPDFKVATSKADKYLRKIAQKEVFDAVFELSDFNVAHSDRFQVTVRSSRDLYNKIQATDFEKSEFQIPKYTVDSYWIGKDTSETGITGETDAPPNKQAFFNTYDRFNYDVVEVQPKYPGGMDAFYSCLARNYRRPEAAVAAGVSGRLIASFVIEKNGDVVDVQILKDLGYGTGEELIRALKRCGKWKPGKMNGKVVRVLYKVPLVLAPLPVPRSSTLPDRAPLPKKLPALEVNKGQYYFENKIAKCNFSVFKDEEGKQAISDRFSVLNHAVSSFAADTLKKIEGRISYQVVVDSTGKGCTVSFKNETNIADRDVPVREAIDSKTIWNLMPMKDGSKGPVSALLVFVFTEDSVKYQHFGFGEGGKLMELESAQKGKFSRW